MKRKHIDYFDFLRGLAIIFVVFNHSYSADPMSDGLIDMIYLLIRQIVTCAVPIFLAQSAFFLSKKNFVNKSEYFSYLKSHSLRIWIPMVIWSLPLFFIKDHHNYIGSFIYMLIGGYSIYYFIPFNNTILCFTASLQKICKKLGGGYTICNQCYICCR